VANTGQGFTPAVQDALRVAYKTALDIGLCCDPADRQEAEKAIEQAYVVSGHHPPREYVWVSSPDAANKLGCAMTNLWGALDIYWVANYMFAIEHFGVSISAQDHQKLMIMYTIAKSCYWWYPYEFVCVICDRPSEVHMQTVGHNEMGLPIMQLHCDGGPAVVFRDGYRVWALHDVRVPQMIAETPGEKLDPTLVIKEKNAEVRRELVRKIGVERLTHKLGAKVLDKRGDYELITLEFGGRVRPYLKMRNPSIGVWHVEGVPPGTLTVDQALAWRNNSTAIPEVLT